EDGIRDRNVTGVQTCALPILRFVSILIPFIGDFRIMFREYLSYSLCDPLFYLLFWCQYDRLVLGSLTQHDTFPWDRFFLVHDITVLAHFSCDVAVSLGEFTFNSWHTRLVLPNPLW